MWQEYINAASVDDVLSVLAEKGDKARIIAGGTDLILEIERGIRSGIETLIDVTRIPELYGITMGADRRVHLGPMVTHNHCVGSKIVREHGIPLALAAWEVGAPQIRTRGTIAGNLITASPANDTIPPLMALGADITLRSKTGERTVSLSDFYPAFRKTVMRSDEMLVDISFPALNSSQRGMFVKLGLRKAQAISVVDLAIVLDFTDEHAVKIEKAAIALGSVTPVIARAAEAEEFLVGKQLTPEVIEETARLAQKAASPIDDVRGSAAYRMEMVRVCTMRGLRAIQVGQEMAGLPEMPILLWGPGSEYVPPAIEEKATATDNSHIVTQINGREYSIATGHEKTLLRWLREDVELVGTKEGCSEGECGACTVFLDGAAVMSCLVPAPRAHGAKIITIEGLATNGSLHPVQQAFIDAGAVQCGYCTPGFLMSAAKLYEESTSPSHSEIKQAITGNLCRCTGYYKILEAIEGAAIAQLSREGEK